jgi:hypothetical protein
MSRVTSALFVA